MERSSAPVGSGIFRCRTGCRPGGRGCSILNGFPSPAVATKLCVVGISNDQRADGHSPSSSGRSFAAASTWASRVPEHRESAFGSRPVSTDVVELIREELATGAGILKTAKELGCGTGTVHRVKRSMAAVVA
jgi:hypothetical protein